MKNTNISIFRLALPIFIQMFLSICLGYVDTIMISKYSQLSVGALGNANQIMMFLRLAFSVIASATGIVVAQYLGANQDKKMNQIYTVAIAFNLVLSLAVCLIVFFFSYNLLSFVNVPLEMINESNSYMKIVGLFLFTDAVSMVFYQVFYCHGKTFLSMLIVFGMNIFNIIGNFCFLFGPLSFLNLGIRGVAISTSVSGILGMMTGFILFKTVIKGHLSVKYLLPFPKEILSKLIKLGVPSAGENISYNISQILITSFVNTMGTLSITTRIYCNILCCFSMIYSNSVASATAIVTGRNVGAGNYDYAYKRVLKSLKGAFIVAVIIAVLNWILSPYTLRFFTSDIDIIKLGKNIMFLAFILELGRTTNLVIIQSLRASGDVVFPTALGICSMWGISVVFAYLFGIVFKFGLQGVWIAMACDEIFRAVVVLIRWITGKWRGKSVVTEKNEE